MKDAKLFSFICSPGVGILDNWLPVIYELQQLQPDSKFIFVIPKASVAELLDPSSVLLKIAQSIFDEIVFVTHSGVWLQVDTFDFAKKINTLSGKKKILIRIVNQLERYVFGVVFVRLISFFIKKYELSKYTKHKFNVNIYTSSVDAVLYDVYEDAKEYNQYFLALNKNIPKFSVSHGINIDVFRVVPRCSDRNKLGIVKTYMFSDAEYKYYTETYNLRDNDIMTVGIPRHDKYWIDYLIKSHEFEEKIKWKGYVFIISRSLSSYFPYERKKQALKDIYQLIVNELNLKIIVKCHPKERNDGLYEEIFGSEEYGTTWMYTNQHPFVIGGNASFAISFFSGVSIDMLALKTPVIEYLDLKGLKEDEGQYFLVGENGEPVLSYRYLGFVLGASNYIELKKHVESILSNRKKVIEELYEVYKDNFSINGGVSRIVASDILLNIPSRNNFMASGLKK